MFRRKSLSLYRINRAFIPPNTSPGLYLLILIKQLLGIAYVILVYVPFPWYSFIVQIALEYGLNGIRIKHDIRIRCIIVHVGIELPTVAVLKGVAYNFILTYPFAEVSFCLSLNSD